MPPRKALIELSLNKKEEILKELDKGVSQRTLAEKFGISKSTVGNIKTQKEQILLALEGNQSEERKRKLRKTCFEDINKGVLSFFKKCRAKNIPVNGPMVQARAKQLAGELKIGKFNASNGWLESFRVRNNIQFKVLCGEGANVDHQAAADWKSKLPQILKDFPPDDQFNADETGLFYRQLPTKSLVCKGELCKGGKMAKERLSVLFCCSATGEKLKPLVIGNAAKPRAFRQNKIDTNNFMVKWAHNKKAWMTRTIFEDWLDSLNRDMKLQKRRIILLIDNATSHTSTKHYSNVVVKFLPPNLTSEIQPLDQGIIQTVKMRYRSKMLLSLLTKIDECRSGTEFCKFINVLDAIRWVVSAWNEVGTSTIRNCFHRSGFPVDVTPTEESSEEVQMEQIISSLPENIQNELVSVDNIGKADEGAIVHEVVADAPDEIMEQVLKEFELAETVDLDDESEEECDETINYRSVTISDALHNINEVLLYASTNQPDLITDVLNIKTKIEQHGGKSKILKQTNLDAFLNNST